MTRNRFQHFSKLLEHLVSRDSQRSKPRLPRAPAGERHTAMESRNSTSSCSRSPAAVAQ